MASVKSNYEIPVTAHPVPGTQYQLGKPQPRRRHHRTRNPLAAIPARVGLVIIRPGVDHPGLGPFSLLSPAKTDARLMLREGRTATAVHSSVPAPASRAAMRSKTAG